MHIQGTASGRQALAPGAHTGAAGGAFEKGLIDIGFTRTLTAEQNKIFCSRHLYYDPMVAVLPGFKKCRNETRAHFGHGKGELRPVSSGRGTGTF